MIHVPASILTPEMITQLQLIVGDSYIFLDQETRDDYGHDETEDFLFPPAVVLKPGTAEEISSILKFANHNLIPVTAIGGRTG